MLAVVLGGGIVDQSVTDNPAITNGINRFDDVEKFARAIYYLTESETSLPENQPKLTCTLPGFGEAR